MSVTKAAAEKTKSPQPDRASPAFERRDPCIPWVGAAASLLLALNPWHIQFTRWAHEASVAPFLAMLVVTALLWAGAALDDDEGHPIRPLRALVAGLLVGMTCYGYAALRI